jgi:DNA-binding protein H-NS
MPAKTTSTDDVRPMDTDTLLDLRNSIDELLEERRKIIERQLGIFDTASRPASQVIAPQYRSRRDPELVWSGRGLLPRWMREEMAGTKLAKEDFRIRKR